MQATEPLAAAGAATPAHATFFPTPTVKRRVTVMVYELFLLFAVEMLAVLVYLLLTGNRQEPLFQHGLKLWLFLVTGLYFTWCWRDSGHTLAMKTWRIKVAQAGHARLPWRTAIVRYLLAWGWFAPALLVCAAAGLHAKGEIAVALVVGIAVWALTAFLDKDRQFLHDRLAGTRLVQLPKIKR
ncbi:RDD family protein [Massilia sp. CFBP9012]|uniref:RDD family protein n=1 Tax=Massilia sp. CFBP9012 TaxID=3096531 RepID=UPI002A6997B6|nr:RDD family protein [Massilia sp. CFBP9012]MDY0977331.1 RDD family protein [Massilia sp. CFBP9012]